jgi:hypothetical protein
MGRELWGGKSEAEFYEAKVLGAVASPCLTRLYHQRHPSFTPKRYAINWIAIPPDE